MPPRDRTRRVPAAGFVRTLAWSPDGSLLATGDTAGSAALHDAESGVNKHAHTSSSQDPIENVCFDFQGTLHAASSKGNLLSVDSSGACRTVKLPMSASPIHLRTFDALIAVADKKDGLTVFDARDLTRALHSHTFKGRLNEFEFLSASRVVAATQVEDDGRLCTIDVATGNVVESLFVSAASSFALSKSDDDFWVGGSDALISKFSDSICVETVDLVETSIRSVDAVSERVACVTEDGVLALRSSDGSFTKKELRLPGNVVRLHPSREVLAYALDEKCARLVL